MRRNASRFAILALALTVCGGASQPPGDADTVTVRRAYQVCAGFCPEYEITVHRDGIVTASTGSSYQVTRQQAARFQSLLAPLQRMGSQTDCDALDPEIEIIWSGTEHRRLHACHGAVYRHLANLGTCALQALHFDVSGVPASRGYSIPSGLLAETCLPTD